MLINIIEDYEIDFTRKTRCYIFGPMDTIKQQDTTDTIKNSYPIRFMYGSLFLFLKWGEAHQTTCICTLVCLIPFHKYLRVVPSVHPDIMIFNAYCSRVLLWNSYHRSTRSGL